MGSFALIKVLIHLPVLTRYGYHQDELYFLACGRHLAWGYVDHPPLVPWLARISDELFGGALWSLRLWPLLAGAATVVLTGLLARRLGGGTFAQGSACGAVIAGPFFLRVGGLLHLPSFEPLFWSLAVYFVVRVLQEDRPRLWLAVGGVAGLGLLNKHTQLLFGGALVLALLLTPARRHLGSRWLWAGGAVALLLLLPNLLWQASLGWPTAVFITNMQGMNSQAISPLLFALGQLLYHGPLAGPLWILGLVFLFRGASGRFRLLGWTYLLLFFGLLAIGSKIYYLAPMYPTLFAAGGVALEAWSRQPRWGWLRPAAAGSVLLGGVLLLPLSLPVLPLQGTERYVEAVTFGAFEGVYELTGDFRGMFGWRERAEAVARVWRRLPPETRNRVPILTTWYGPAAAIDYFGRRHGLPPAVSGHMSYHLWGPPPDPFDVAVAAGIEPEQLEELFEEVDVVERLEFPEANPGDRSWPVAVCRKPRVDLRRSWPSFRRWSHG